MLLTIRKMQIKSQLRGPAPDHLTFASPGFFFSFQKLLFLQSRGTMALPVPSLVGMLLRPALGDISTYLASVVNTGKNRGSELAHSEPSLPFCWKNQERGGITICRANLQLLENQPANEASIEKSRKED